MSAYITLHTPMLDEESLVAAIVDSGVAPTAIEVSPSPVSLQGWGGRREANIILRKKVTGDPYNDIGFLQTPTGYRAILSDDHPHFGRTWLSELTSRYQHHWTRKQEKLAEAERARLAQERRRLVEAQRQTVKDRARKMGYRVRESRQGDTLRLVLIKREY